MGEAAASALAAGAVAADDILRLRNGDGDPQQISVDKRIAVASLRGYKFMRIEGSRQLVANYTLPTSGFYCCPA